MAKKSSIEKNALRTKLSKQGAARRARLKALARDRDAVPEERFAAQLKLAESLSSSSMILPPIFMIESCILLFF